MSELEFSTNSAQFFDPSFRSDDRMLLKIRRKGRVCESLVFEPPPLFDVLLIEVIGGSGAEIRAFEGKNFPYRFNVSDLSNEG